MTPNTDANAVRWKADFEYVYKAVDAIIDVRNSTLCELITQALERQGHLPDDVRQACEGLVQPQALDAIEAAVQRRLKRQAMLARHERILGGVSLPETLSWDPLIGALCEHLQQATDEYKQSPQVKAHAIQDADGALVFRGSLGDDYQQGLIAMTEALSVMWPDAGLRDKAEGEAQYKALMKRHALILRPIECDAGWVGLIQALCDELQYATDHMGAPQVQTQQVKEKFGGLRFYTGKVNDYQNGLISMTRTMANITCEQCGRPGAIWVSGGYFHAACEQHRRPASITSQTYYLQRKEASNNPAVKPVT